MDNIGIKRIEIRDLFGYYDYTFDMTKIENNKMLILYGDNGSGKTTILKSILFLLSSADKAGHKSGLARISFKKIDITLSNNVTIGASRLNDIIGSYNYYLLEDNVEKYNIFLQADENNDNAINVSDSTEEGKKFHELLKFIKSLNIEIFFLSDSRKQMKTIDQPSTSESDLINALSTTKLLFENELKFRKRTNIAEKDILENTIKIFEDWIKEQALKASNYGENKTNTIYLDIVNNIIIPGPEKIEKIEEKIKAIQELILDISVRSKAYEKVGLITRSEYEQLSKAFNIQNDQKKEIIYNILEPFIKGIKAKLDAQSDLQETLTSFINITNSFLTNKLLSFELQSGFKVTQNHTEKNIPFSSLSSGEKQIILLFCCSILASNQATFFIIDEPELSLNIKWQRKLLSSLLFLSKSRNIHFIIATHSIELLASNRDNVIKLVNSKKF